MIILLAGLQGIPKTYYEAASLDGASSLKQFFHITVPLITPTLFFVMITTTIGVFQTFDIIYLMISRISPAVSHTDSLLVYFYRYAFVYSKKGYASAIAVLLFVIVMFLENCCFGKTELMLLNMVRSGVLGTIVHCSGGYQHDLRESLFQSFENKRSRLQNYLSRNCDSYPTHDAD